MAKVGIGGLCLAALTGFASAVVAQETPGQIQDPGSYSGSMALQRQDQQEQQQVQQQNDQMLGRLNETYGQSAPSGGRGQGGGGRAPRQVNWRARPPLPAARNPLLGRWRQVAARPVSGEQLVGPLGGMLPPGAADVSAGILNGATAGGCKSIFGGGVVAFEPAALQWVAPDGHEEILNHVDYRADGPNVVVLANDPGSVPWLIFGFPSRDHAVVALLNCTMTRVTAATVARSMGPPATSQVASLPSSSAPGRLSLQAGTAGPGSFTPLSGAVFYVVTHDPDAALVQSGFTGSSPINAWFEACRTSKERCAAGIRAMTAGAVGNTRTDVNGNGEVPQLPAGNYYVVGHAAYQGKELVWHRPLNVHPGENRVILDQTSASLG